MKVFIFFALLAFALTATFHVEETKEEVNLEGSVDISRALECISALGGSASCVSAVSNALSSRNLSAALNALSTCTKAASNIYNNCYSLVVRAAS